MASGDRATEGDVVPATGAQPLPGFRLLRRLGRGGFGEVWEAEVPGGLRVALKFVRLEGDAGRAELRALELLKSIRHGNLLALFGAWKVADSLIIGMELADRTLMDRHDEARAAGLAGIPRDELLEYMAEAAKGIDHLNEHKHALDGREGVGVQHRDIKPQNILLVGDGVKVADFGLARLLERSAASHTGGLTPSYAAPEFFDHRTSDRSDQYSLAVSYCLLRGGRLPYVGHAAAVVAGHLHRPPDLTMLPEPERAAVARALSKDPSGRWPSCRAFVGALGQTRAATTLPHPGPPAATDPPVDFGDSSPPSHPGHEPRTAPDPSRTTARGAPTPGTRDIASDPTAAVADAPSRERDPAPLKARPGPGARPRWVTLAASLLVTAGLALGLWKIGRIASSGWPTGPAGSRGPARTSKGIDTGAPAPYAGSPALPGGPPGGAAAETASRLADAKARSEQGDAHFDAGRYDLAVEEYTAAIRLAPREAKLYFNRGNAYAATDKHDLAIADYTKAIGLDESDPDFYNNRGASHEALGDFDRAISDFDEAIRLYPNDPRSHNNRGVAYQRKGDSARARADFDAADRLKPKSPR